MYFEVIKLFTAFLALGGTILPANGGLIPPGSNVLLPRNEQPSDGDIAKRGFGGFPKWHKTPSPPLGGPSRRPGLAAPAAGGSIPGAIGHIGQDTRKTPVNFEDTSYTVTVDEVAGEETLYTVYRKGKSDPDSDMPVNVFSVDSEKNRLTVRLAENEIDRTLGNNPLKLSEIQMGVWAKAGKSPDELQTVRYQDILNDELEDAIEDARDDLGAPWFTVRASDEGVQKAVFDRLVTADKSTGAGGNGLTGSLQSTIRDYHVGKRPSEIRVFEDEDGGSAIMDVHLA